MSTGKKNKIVIDSFEDEGNALELCGDFTKADPKYYLMWNDKQIGFILPEYHTVSNRFRDMREILYDIFHWAYCDECKQVEKDAMKYTITYTNGHSQTLGICPFMYHGYNERRMRDDGDVDTIIPALEAHEL